MTYLPRLEVQVRYFTQLQTCKKLSPIFLFQQFAPRAVTASAATAGAPGSAAARWAGREPRARSATATLAACTAPATAPGSAYARRAGGACCAMKVCTKKNLITDKR